MPNTDLSTSNPADSIPWYDQWFDSLYYPILYRDRDYHEAQLFMDNITAYLNLPEQGKILDLACGRGRHSIYLNQLGYDVTGVDLSHNSIEQAKKHENETLRFFVHDMRQPFSGQFDAVFNLFTSFGYFDDDADNFKTIQSIRENLSEYGFAVIDFMNVEKVIPNLVAQEIKEVDGIAFHLKRYYQDGHIFKEIRFEDQGQSYFFTEKVQALRLADFEQMIEQAGMYLLDVFGDYRLKKYHPTESDRLILVIK